MAIFRTIKTNKYTQIENCTLQDKNLSLKAKGLLVLMLSLPNTWNFSVNGLKAMCTESTTAIRTALQELEDKNYLYRERVHKNGRLAEMMYSIFELSDDCIAYKQKQESEKQRLENQTFEIVDNKEINKQTIKMNKDNTTINSSIENSETFFNTVKKKSKKSMYSKCMDLINDFTDNEYLKELLEKFLRVCIQNAKDSNYSLVPNVFKGKLNKITKYSKTLDDKIQIVQYSVDNGYSGIYELKKNQSNKSIGCNKQGIFQDNISPDTRDHSGKEFEVVDEEF